MEYEPGDIFQVKPSSENEKFRGCLIIAEEIKEKLIIGYVKIPGTSSVTYVRCLIEDLVFVGKARYVEGLVNEELEGWVRISNEINC